MTERFPSHSSDSHAEKTKDNLDSESIPKAPTGREIVLGRIKKTERRTEVETPEGVIQIGLRSIPESLYVPDEGGNPIRTEMYRLASSATPFLEKVSAKERKILKKIREKSLERWQREALPMPENLKLFIKKAIEHRTNYLRTHGITKDIIFPEVFLVPRGSVPSYIGAATADDCILLFHEESGHPYADGLNGQRDAITEKIERYLMRRNLMHELSHTTPYPPSIIAERIKKSEGDKEGHVFLKNERRGLIYEWRLGAIQEELVEHIPENLSKDQKELLLFRGKSSALEEGMARLYEDRSEELLRKELPEESLLYERLLRTGIKSLMQKGEESAEDFYVFTANEKEIILLEKGYINSMMLRDYLLETISNFENLALQAQQEDKIIPLARAVEDVFGPHSYKEVALATEFSAPAVIERLKELKRIRGEEKEERATETVS